MTLIMEIPFKYPEDYIIFTEEFYGYGIENVTGGDIPYPIGRDLHVSQKVHIYKFIDGLKEHIVVSKDKLNKELKDTVCLYSKYYWPNIAPVICRYMPSYSKAYAWINESEEKPFNSVWYGFLEHPYHTLQKQEETFFNTFSDIDVISLLTSSYLKDTIHKHYKTDCLHIQPNTVLNKKTLHEYLNNRFNINRVNKIESFEFKDDRLLNNINVDDVYIVNKINTLPIRSLSCIYYSKEDRLIINNMELIVTTNIPDVIKTIKEIMNVFSHEDKIEFSYLNEEIFIKTKKQNIYINIPVLDLCNSLLQN